VKTKLLELLRCPTTGQSLTLEADGNNSQLIDVGWLVSEDGQHRYPIRNGIPRFVPESNYADNFGMQWNHFRQTQLDSHSGQPISSDRFWLSTNWTPADLKNLWVLDVGCGAGRFAEVALNAGAKLVALDYSNSVDACYANLKHHPNLYVVQGDIYALPFALGEFQFVYSLGVLQHTPDVYKAFAALPPMLRVGGSLCVDYYEKSWKSIFHIKYWLRPITKRLAKATLFSLLQKAIPVLLPLSRLLGGMPLVGGVLKRLIPVVNYYGTLQFTTQQHLEWSLLDTFDWLAPHYDQPQTASTALQWMEQVGMNDIEVLKAGHLVARGTKLK
jgi:2-polyprenyl-3-methyl-5-hydroxy-6-metoxy-1,4-benzoquinol methylase